MHRLPTPRQLHRRALHHLQRDEHRQALPLLSRLLLALPPGHEAEPGVRRTLAFVLGELGRYGDAARVCPQRRSRAR